jgi:hypothetical protein
MMAAGDQPYTYNTLSNEDKELLMSHGYRPGELEPDEARELLEDLRDQTAGDGDSYHPSHEVVADERDGTE